MNLLIIMNGLASWGFLWDDYFLLDCIKGTQFKGALLTPLPPTPLQTQRSHIPLHPHPTTSYFPMGDAMNVHSPAWFSLYSQDLPASLV